MKLVHITFQFQYAEAIEAILARCHVTDMVRYPRVVGRDRDGRHEGSQAFPGHMAAIHAHVPQERLEDLWALLREFRDAKRAHAHLQAVVLPVERLL